MGGSGDEEIKKPFQNRTAHAKPTQGFKRFFILEYTPPIRRSRQNIICSAFFYFLFSIYKMFNRIRNIKYILFVPLPRLTDYLFQVSRSASPDTKRGQTRTTAIFHDLRTKVYKCIRIIFIYIETEKNRLKIQFKGV